MEVQEMVTYGSGQGLEDERPNINESHFATEGTSNLCCPSGKDHTLDKGREILLNGVLLQEAEFYLNAGFTEKRLANVLFILSKEKACAEAIAAKQGVFLLIKFLKSPIQTTKALACITIGRVSKFASEEDLKHAIPSLVELLASYPSLMDVAETAAFALGRLAKAGDDMRATIGVSGAVLILLDIALQCNGRQRTVALQALREVVIFTDMNLTLLARSGRLTDIAHLVLSSSSEAKCLAAEVLSALAGLNEIRRAIINLSAIPALIEAAKVGCIASRARAAQALGFLSFTKRARKTIVNDGGVPVLVDLLNNGDDFAKLIAGNALGILSPNADHIHSVAQAGAIPLYVKFLEGNDPLGKEIAEDAFCILAVSEDNALAIAEHLVRILECGNTETKAAAADIMWDLSSYKHSTSVMQCVGAIPLLVSLLQDESKDVRESISGAVAQLSYNDSDKQAMSEVGVIPILVGLLQDPSDDVKENVAEALLNFAESSFYRIEMLEACAIPALLELQNSPSTQSRYTEIGDYVTAALRYLGQQS